MVQKTSSCTPANQSLEAYSAVILLHAHSASFAHNFVSGEQSFLFQRVQGCNSIADLSLKIVFWTHKFAVGLIDIGNSEYQDP